MGFQAIVSERRILLPPEIFHRTRENNVDCRLQFKRFGLSQLKKFWGTVNIKSITKS